MMLLTSGRDRKEREQFRAFLRSYKFENEESLD
jgi:hypothetical protein